MDVPFYVNVFENFWHPSSKRTSHKDTDSCKLMTQSIRGKVYVADGFLWCFSTAYFSPVVSLWIAALSSGDKSAKTLPVSVREDCKISAEVGGCNVLMKPACVSQTDGLSWGALGTVRSWVDNELAPGWCWLDGNSSFLDDRSNLLCTALGEFWL